MQARISCMATGPTAPGLQIFGPPHVQQRDLTSLWWPLLAFENLMIYGPGADGTHVHATFEILLPVRLAGLPIRILIARSPDTRDRRGSRNHASRLRLSAAGRRNLVECSSHQEPRTSINHQSAICAVCRYVPNCLCGDRLNDLCAIGSMIC